MGSHLVKLLSGKAATVRALYHKNKPSDELSSLTGVSWMRCDLLDIFDVEEAMKDVIEVYHCAAIVSFKKEDKEQLLHFNVESTANVVNEALLQNVPKLVYVSSIASLGKSKVGVPITEEVQWEESTQNSVYAQSKNLAELEVWRGLGEGLDATVVNPGIILGEGDWETGSANLVKMAYEEFPYYTEGTNAWVDVEDVVNVMYLLMKSDIVGERYILSAGNFSYKDVFTVLAEVMKRKPPYKPAGKFMSGLLWRLIALRKFFTGKDSSLTKETARTAQRKSMYDNTKLLKAFPDYGYTPLKSTLDRVAKAFMAKNA